MTAIVNTPEPGSDSLPQRQLEPTFTLAQTKQSGLTTYKVATLVEQLYAMTVKHHLLAGTPRHEWKPPTAVRILLSTIHNSQVAEALEFKCSEHLDPRIQEIADRGEEVETHVQDLVERDPKLISAETGLVYTEDKAVSQVESNQAKISADKKRGRSHHQRVPRWLRRLGKIIPYGEALGLIVLLSFFLNVEWTRPAQDPLTWTLSVVVVLATLLFTPRVVERAGEGWNRRREAVAEDQIQARRTATKRIVVNGTIATVVSVAIVAGLVERALAVTDDTLPQSMLVLIVALCVIAGLAMPAIAYLAIAWDGSSLSRENDNLVEQLNDGLEEDQQLRSEAMSQHHACEQDELHINTEVAPSLLRIAYEGVDEMRQAYAFLHVQLGVESDVSARPAAKPAGDESDCIPTGVPGADPIRLESLVSRGLRIQELQRRRSETIATLNALPVHPWAGNHSRPLA